MSSSSKKNGGFSLEEEEPPPNKVIGPPKDPAEIRKFLDFQERAKQALSQPFFLKPHVVQQNLNPNPFSVKSLINNTTGSNTSLPLDRSSATPPKPTQSPLSSRSPPIIGLPLPFSPSLHSPLAHCATPMGMKVEGGLTHGKFNGSESTPFLQPMPMNIKCQQSGFFAPISVLTCSPPNFMTNFPAAFPAQSPLPGIPSISPLTYAPFSPMLINNAMATSVGNSPRSTMGASVMSDGSSGYRTEGSKGPRSEYTVGQNHPKPNYLRQEEEEESDVDFLEDSNSSGRVSPADDLDDIDIDDNPPPLHSTSPVVAMGAGHIQPIRTNGQSSASDIDTKEERVLHLHQSSVHSEGQHLCTEGGEQDAAVTHEATGVVSGERPSSGVSSMSSSDHSALSVSPEPFKLCAGSEIDGPNAEVFGHVPGRLSLLSATPKYRVTVDEIRRRLSHPESLNASILGGLLRRAKSKNGGHVLRQKLDSIGVKLPPGKRKTSELTLLTAMVEGEALHLAKDYQLVTKREFPHTAVAQHIAKKQMSSSSNVSSKERIRTVKAAKTLIKEIQSLVQPSTMVREWPEKADHLSQGLARYSLITHSFGPLALNTGISSVLASLDDLQDIYEGKKQLHNPPPVSCATSSFSVGSLQMQPHQQLGRVPHPGPTHSGIECMKQEVEQHVDHAHDSCPVVMPTQFE